jgi:hypoxanthine phosphoribosyltransferase
MNIPEHIRAVYRHAQCLYRKEEVDNALDRMGFEIHNLLEYENPLLLCVMVGGLIPTGHLLTRIDFPLELDYIHATRYQGETWGGTLKWKNKPNAALVNRTVLIIDDILDGGITLQYLVDFCYHRGAKTVYTAVLVEKEGVRLPEGLPQADITGLVIHDHYVFGYGMDYKEYLRNAPGIYAVAPEHMEGQ